MMLDWRPMRMVRIIAPHPHDPLGKRGLLYWRSDAGHIRMDDDFPPFREGVDVKVMGWHVFIDRIGPAPIKVRVLRLRQEEPAT